jgi:hypothetical protein
VRLPTDAVRQDKSVAAFEPDVIVIGVRCDRVRAVGGADRSYCGGWLQYALHRDGVGTDILYRALFAQST